MLHEATICKRIMGIELRYSFRNWSDRFLCPICGSSKRYNLNFLGRRNVICDGKTIKTIAKSTLSLRG